MICPKCGTEFKHIVNGRLVNAQVEKCFCGFVMAKTNEETIVEYATKNIIEKGEEFLQTNDVECINAIEVYFNLLKLELKEEEFPLRPEVSG